jgi:hypothetical protein
MDAGSLQPRDRRLIVNSGHVEDGGCHAWTVQMIPSPSELGAEEIVQSGALAQARGRSNWCPCNRCRYVVRGLALRRRFPASGCDVRGRAAYVGTSSGNCAGISVWRRHFCPPQRLQLGIKPAAVAAIRTALNYFLSRDMWEGGILARQAKV